SVVLNNRFYLGLIPIRKHNVVYTGAHEPLVSKKLFDQVQEVLKGKTMLHARQHFFLFVRMITCKLCSYHLSGEIQKGHTYYTCKNRKCSKRKSFREETIEAAILEKFRHIQFTETEENFFRKKFEEFSANLASAQDQNLKNLRLQLDQLVA